MRISVAVDGVPTAACKNRAVPSPDATCAGRCDDGLMDLHWAGFSGTLQDRCEQCFGPGGAGGEVASRWSHHRVSYRWLCWYRWQAAGGLIGGDGTWPSVRRMLLWRIFFVPGVSV